MAKRLVRKARRGGRNVNGHTVRQSYSVEQMLNSQAANKAAKKRMRRNRRVV